MIYLSLPKFFNNFYFYVNLCKFILRNPDKVNKEYNIESLYGSFSYCSWNGDINSNYGSINLNYDFYSCPNQAPKVLRYDFSNILLEENDFYDAHCNSILLENQNGCTQIELSNLKLLNYLQSQYNNFNYVFSGKADCIFPFTEEIINVLSDQQDFILINLPGYLNKNKQLLNNLKNKHKIELTIGNKCGNCSVENYKECLISENTRQLEFSEISYFNKCSKNQYYLNNIDFKKEIELFYNLGFRHFKLDAPPNHLINQFNRKLINLLIKTEYIDYFWDNFDKNKR